MRVFKIFVDDVKEEQWINEMAQQGWHFQKMRFPYYTFEKGTPGEYIYRLEMIEGLKKNEDTSEYLEFVQNTGVELVQKRFRWAYFRQHKIKGPFELYSDAQSKLTYLNRILATYYMVIIINLLAAILNGLFSLERIGSNFNFFACVISTAVVIICLIPTTKVWFRKRNLKKAIEMFGV